MRRSPLMALLLFGLLAALPLALLLGWQRRQHEDLRREVTVLHERVAALSTKLDQQTAVLHRALGKYVPVEVPPETLQQIQGFQDRLADVQRWPSSAESAEQLRLELEDLLKKRVPPW